MKANAHNLLELVKPEKHATDEFIDLPLGQRPLCRDLIPLRISLAHCGTSARRTRGINECTGVIWLNLSTWKRG